MTTPEPTPAAPAGPVCTLCGKKAVVSWQRRLTPAEIAEAQALEQARRDQALLLADPQLPPPDFGPLPGCADWTRIVHGCATHGIEPDAAALIHQGDCTAPQVADLPGCDCTPEPTPQPALEPEPAPLPAGW
jgi:hypothetical protein